MQFFVKLSVLRAIGFVLLASLLAYGAQYATAKDFYTAGVQSASVAAVIIALFVFCAFTGGGKPKKAASNGGKKPQRGPETGVAREEVGQRAGHTGRWGGGIELSFRLRPDQRRQNLKQGCPFHKRISQYWSVHSRRIPKGLIDLGNRR